MVGVPGKSKGCSTCRRRKKGCDQRRPICGQCASSGYVCGGYTRDRTFVLHPASKDVERAVFLPYARPKPVVLLSSINRSAIVLQCHGLFPQLFMPQGDAECHDEFILKCGHPMSWTELVPHILHQDRSLQDAFSAVSISRVGQGHRDSRLLRESTKFYGKALKELQAALLDPTRTQSDHVLMACLLLGMYEVLEGPAFDSRTWLAHAQGASRLVQFRGPERHRSWDAHHTFLASRIPILYAAMVQRTATYLATEEWLTVPWAKPHRTYFDRLVDMATQIPTILEKADLVRRQKSGPGAEDLWHLIKECEELQLRMNRWKDATKKGAHPRVQKHDPGEQSDYPFETDLWFDNHLFVHARLFYFTCSLVVAELVEDLLLDLARQDHKVSEPAEWTALHELFNAFRQAANICRTVSYCLQPEMGAMGAMMVNFPANLALKYFRRTGYTPGTNWLTKAFHALRSRGIHLDSESDVHSSASSSEEDGYSSSQRACSADSCSSDTPPSSTHSCPGNTPLFIYEDPSRAYYEGSSEPD